LKKLTLLFFQFENYFNVNSKVDQARRILEEQRNSTQLFDHLYSGHRSIFSPYNKEIMKQKIDEAKQFAFNLYDKLCPLTFKGKEDEWAPLCIYHPCRNKSISKFWKNQCTPQHGIIYSKNKSTSNLIPSYSIRQKSKQFIRNYSNPNIYPLSYSPSYQSHLQQFRQRNYKVGLMSDRKYKNDQKYKNFFTTQRQENDFYLQKFRVNKFNQNEKSSSIITPSKTNAEKSFNKDTIISNKTESSSIQKVKQELISPPKGVKNNIAQSYSMQEPFRNFKPDDQKGIKEANLKLMNPNIRPSQNVKNSNGPNRHRFNEIEKNLIKNIHQFHNLRSKVE